jgi:hypothetical protein
MGVFCTDGTVFTCRSYDLTEHGVELYSKRPDPDDERDAGDPEQVGYLPHERLLYILPDAIIPATPVGVQAAGQYQPQRRPDQPAPSTPTQPR